MAHRMAQTLLLALAIEDPKDPGYAGFWGSYAWHAANIQMRYFALHLYYYSPLMSLSSKF